MRHSCVRTRTGRWIRFGGVLQSREGDVEVRSCSSFSAMFYPARMYVPVFLSAEACATVLPLVSVFLLNLRPFRPSFFLPYS
jgi:hypothetical protein